MKVALIDVFRVDPVWQIAGHKDQTLAEKVSICPVVKECRCFISETDLHDVCLDLNILYWSAKIVLQASLTVAVRYGATRHQFGPPGSSEIAVLDYASQQLKLMPMLAMCYALHFTGQHLVKQYAEMKRTKDDDLIADVHALSAGDHLFVSHLGKSLANPWTSFSICCCSSLDC